MLHPNSATTPSTNNNKLNAEIANFITCYSFSKKRNDIPWKLVKIETIKLDNTGGM